MRTRRSPLGRIMDLPGPPKALLNTASTVAAFPLRQAEKAAKKARSVASSAASAGVQTGFRAVTGVAGALSSVRGRTEPTEEARVVVVPPAPRVPPAPPPPPTATVPPSAAQRLLADESADPPPEPTQLHRPGQDVFPIKDYAKLSAPDAITALRTLERQADVALVLQHERAHRNRKSVTAAAEARLAQLGALDVRT